MYGCGGYPRCKRDRPFYFRILIYTIEREKLEGEVVHRELNGKENSASWETVNSHSSDVIQLDFSVDFSLPAPILVRFRLFVNTIVYTDIKKLYGCYAPFSLCY